MALAAHPPSLFGGGHTQFDRVQMNHKEHEEHKVLANAFFLFFVSFVPFVVGS